MLLDELMIQNRDGGVIRKIFRSGNSMFKYAKNFNGKCNLFCSVYTFTDTFVNKQGRTRPCNPIIDKIYLDFDVKDDPNFPNYAQVVAKYLHDNDISFYIRFSGRGFHIYIQLQSKELKNPAMAIRNWVATLHKDTNTESDSSVVGDLSRVSRMLHFLNLKSNRYCIPIQYDELMSSSYEEICEMAEEDRECDDFINGSVLVDISDFDTEKILNPLKSNVANHVVEIRDDIVDDFPPCIKKFLSDPELSHSNRIQLIVFLRDMGYTEEETISLLEKSLSPEKFHHSVFEERQVTKFYTDYNYLFKSCYKHKEQGVCPSNDCDGCDIYY